MGDPSYDIDLIVGTSPDGAHPRIESPSPLDHRGADLVGLCWVGRRGASDPPWSSGRREARTAHSCLALAPDEESPRRLPTPPFIPGSRWLFNGSPSDVLPRELSQAVRSRGCPLSCSPLFCRPEIAFTGSFSSYDFSYFIFKSPRRWNSCPSLKSS